MSWDSFLMKFLKKKEVCGSHKQYTRHTKNSTTATKRTSKKKETNKQTQTRDNRYPNGYPIFSVVGSWLPLSSQIQFWTLNLTFIYKIFLKKKNLFMRNKYTHTQGRKKWILIQKHTTNSTPTLLPNSILNLEPHLHIIIFFFRSKHTQGRERNSNTKAHYKLHSKAMKNLLSLELALKVFVYVYVSYNSKIYF